MMHFDIYKMNGNSNFISGETGAWRDYGDLGVKGHQQSCFLSAL